LVVIGSIARSSGTGVVEVSTVVVHIEGGQPFDGIFALGEDEGGPAIVVLTEMFGVSEAMRMVALDFAASGVPTLVPNLFWRSEVTRALDYDGEDRAIAWARLAGFDKERGIADLDRVAGWMHARLCASRPLVLVGFCGGGLWSYLAAARGRFDAAAIFYALGIAKHLDRMGQIGCPVQLHYGLADPHIPHDEIEAVRSAAANNPQVEIFTYAGAGHSFASPVRPSYDPEATGLAMERVRALLSRVAGQKPD
jgi:carboxymethylenebutenolidase